MDGGASESDVAAAWAAHSTIIGSGRHRKQALASGVGAGGVAHGVAAAMSRAHASRTSGGAKTREWRRNNPAVANQTIRK